MSSYLDEDFLLDTPAARMLYHDFAEGLPIIDYHCHLPPREIAEDRRWSDLAELWLGGDHYKWRQMRSCGIDERFVTGSASAHDKFVQYACAMERLVGNPLFDWSHLELKRFFGITDRLCGRTAERIWEASQARLREPSSSARGFMRQFKVEVVCTTDDPDDELVWHRQIAEHPFGVKVLPTWRPDRLLKEMVAKGETSMRHLKERHDFFAQAGCRLADYGLVEIPTEGPMADLLFECLKLDAQSGWTAQLHFNCIRNLNGAAFAKLGPDTGYDAIGDARCADALARLLDRLEREDALPQLVIYSLNPADMTAIASIIGSFQKGPVRGKIQLGAPWWFLDHKHGIRRHFEILSSLGCLGNFIGMLTDSRSFLSYARHEYFRRLLCQKLGEDVARGEIPDDLEWLGGLVRDISYFNAKQFFNF